MSNELTLSTLLPRLTDQNEVRQKTFVGIDFGTSTSVASFWVTISILTYALDRKPDPFGVKEAIEHHKVAQSSLATMANDLNTHGVARRFDQYVALPGALVSSLVFLKLSHEIREHNQSLNREWLRGCLGPIHDQASVARGVWWCGGFWGFTPFAEEYYAIAALPEAPEPRFPDNLPAPPAREPRA